MIILSLLENNVHVRKDKQKFIALLYEIEMRRNLIRLQSRFLPQERIFQRIIHFSMVTKFTGHTIEIKIQ